VFLRDHSMRSRQEALIPCSTQPLSHGVMHPLPVVLQHQFLCGVVQALHSAEQSNPVKFKVVVTALNTAGSSVAVLVVVHWHMTWWRSQHHATLSSVQPSAGGSMQMGWRIMPLARSVVSAPLPSLAGFLESHRVSPAWSRRM